MSSTRMPNVQQNIFSSPQLSILVNAFVLAFTSELIPKLVYVYKISPDGSLHGYVNHSLSYFHVKDFTKNSRPDKPTSVVNYTMPTCRYAYVLHIFVLISLCNNNNVKIMPRMVKHINLADSDPADVNTYQAMKVLEIDQTI